MESLSLIAAGLTLNAPNFGEENLGVTYLEWLTNSMSWQLSSLRWSLWWARKRDQDDAAGSRRRRKTPSKRSSSFLYDMLEGIVGKHMVARVFSLLATLFIFILFANWFSLLPGVGSIGWGHDVPDHGFEVEVPLVAADDRGSQHDAGHGARGLLCFWLYWTISEVGVWGFLVHTFGPKGGLKGVMKLLFADHLLLCGSYRGGLHLGSTCLPLAATFRQRFCRRDSALLQ